MKKKSKKPMSYEEFRTGLSYADVYWYIFSRKWKRRNGVLGAWHQIKQEMYREYLEKFDQEEKVPF